MKDLDKKSLSERDICTKFITPAVKRAGWDREKYQTLSEELGREQLEDRKQRALRLVNTHAARLMPLLDSERPEDPVSLEINDLTVKVTGTDRDDYLRRSAAVRIGCPTMWLLLWLSSSTFSLWRTAQCQAS